MGAHLNTKLIFKYCLNNLAYLLFILATIYGLYQMYSMRNSNIELQRAITSKDNCLSHLEELNKKLVFFETLNYKLNNTLINNTYVYDINNDSILLKELLVFPKIILHYSELTCMDCVDQEIKKP